jgi:hypothetical protein
MSSKKWSTQKIKEMMARYEETGIMDKDNPFWQGKVDWRKGYLDYEYTKEELLEMGKIAKDILYFAETYANVQTDAGRKLIKLRKYQIKVLLQFWKHRFNVYLASRQCGKCVSFDTLVNISFPKSVTYKEIPIFELYYMFKDKGFLDRVELTLYRVMYSTKRYMREHRYE